MAGYPWRCALGELLQRARGLGPADGGPDLGTKEVRGLQPEGREHVRARASPWQLTAQLPSFVLPDRERRSLVVRARGTSQTKASAPARIAAVKVQRREHGLEWGILSNAHGVTPGTSGVISGSASGLSFGPHLEYMSSR